MTTFTANIYLKTKQPQRIHSSQLFCSVRCPISLVEFGLETLMQMAHDWSSGCPHCPLHTQNMWLKRKKKKISENCRNWKYCLFWIKDFNYFRSYNAYLTPVPFDLLNSNLKTSCKITLMITQLDPYSQKLIFSCYCTLYCYSAIFILSIREHLMLIASCHKITIIIFFFFLFLLQGG